LGRNKSETAAIERRRATVADLYIQGWMQAEIAHHVGVSQPTVSTDIKAIQKHWRASAIRDFDVLRERELQKLARLEREAWAAWERSQKPSQEAVISSDGTRQKTQKRVAEQAGDARFLEQIHKCIASRRALLGLDAPTRIAPTSPDGKEPYHSYVMAELMKLAEQTGIEPQVVDGPFGEQKSQQVLMDGAAPAIAIEMSGGEALDGSKGQDA
jgi:predicted transcriptional regulator